MDAIPLGALDGIGVVGVCVLIVIGYSTGRIVTRREANAIEERAHTAEARLDKALDQNTALMDMARLGAATMQALNQAANE